LVKVGKTERIAGAIACAIFEEKDTGEGAGAT
jgi:hypothetical protein